MNFNKYLLSPNDNRIPAVINKIEMQEINELTPEGLLQIFLGSPFSVLCIPAEDSIELPGGREMQKAVWDEVKSKTKLAWGYMMGRDAIICIVFPRAYCAGQTPVVRTDAFSGYHPSGKPAVFILRNLPIKAKQIFQRKNQVITETQSAKPQAKKEKVETVEEPDKSIAEERIKKAAKAAGAAAAAGATGIGKTAGKAAKAVSGKDWSKFDIPDKDDDEPVYLEDEGKPKKGYIPDDEDDEDEPDYDESEDWDDEEDEDEDDESYEDPDDEDEDEESAPRKAKKPVKASKGKKNRSALNKRSGNPAKRKADALAEASRRLEESESGGIMDTIMKLLLYVAIALLAAGISFAGFSIVKARMASKAAQEISAANIAADETEANAEDETVTREDLELNGINFTDEALPEGTDDPNAAAQGNTFTYNADAPFETELTPEEEAMLAEMEAVQDAPAVSASEYDNEDMFVTEETTVPEAETELEPVPTEAAEEEAAEAEAEPAPAEELTLADEEVPAETEDTAEAEAEAEAEEIALPADDEAAAEAEAETELEPVPAETVEEETTEAEPEETAEEPVEEKPAEEAVEAKAPAEAETEAPAEPAETAKKKYVVCTANTAMNVRMQPSSQSALAGVMASGDEALIVDDTSDPNWIKIEFLNGQAWVSRTYVNVIEK